MACILSGQAIVDLREEEKSDTGLTASVLKQDPNTHTVQGKALPVYLFAYRMSLAKRFLYTYLLTGRYWQSASCIPTCLQDATDKVFPVYLLAYRTLLAKCFLYTYLLTGRYWRSASCIPTCLQDATGKMLPVYLLGYPGGRYWQSASCTPTWLSGRTLLAKCFLYTWFGYRTLLAKCFLYTGLLLGRYWPSASITKLSLKGSTISLKGKKKVCKMGDSISAIVP